MQICKKSKGITLVALIITIIVLLILAGVSLSFVFNGEILDKAQQAVNEYKNASINEQEVINQIDKYLQDEIGGGSGGGPEEPSVDSNGLADKDTTIVAKDDPNVQIVIPEGFAPAILMTGRTDSMPGENGAVKELMTVEEWANITSDQINKGIVLVDNVITYDGGHVTGTVSDFNEYVWIPITDSSKFARVAWTTPFGYDESGRYLTGGKVHLLSEESQMNRFWEDKTTEEYVDMIDSVKVNKGFYISRYEASQKDSITAQSKRNRDAWSGASQTTAATGSINMKPDINSHLIYGVEWDSVLQWLLDSGAQIGAETSGITKTITLEDVQKDSRSWGNYEDSIGGATANSGGSSAEPTGANEYWKVNNIYDLAGNMSEWTQEKYSTGTFRVGRGGSYDSLGYDIPVATRYYNDENLVYDSTSRIQSRFLSIILLDGVIIQCVNVYNLLKSSILCL